MAKRQRPRPTEAELAILGVLWQRGPCTVRQVHESLGGDRKTRYTTTLKQLQVMDEKGLVVRDTSDRSHVYRAAIDESATKRRLVGQLIDRVFGGSARKMVLHALEAGKLTDEELAEIRRILDQREKKK